MAGQGRPSRQSAPEQAERQAWRVLVMVLKAKLEAVEAGITTITGFQEQDMPTNKGPEKQIGKDDVAAGAAGCCGRCGLGRLGWGRTGNRRWGNSHSRRGSSGGSCCCGWGCRLWRLEGGQGLQEEVSLMPCDPVITLGDLPLPLRQVTLGRDG